MNYIGQLHVNTVKILSMLYTNDCHLNNVVSLANIPSINLGRRAGHSTALMLFITSQPEKTFAICNHSRALYNQLYGRLDNCVYLDSNTCSNIRGRRVSYIVIEDMSAANSVRVHNAERCIDNIRPALQKNTLIVKLG